MNTLYYRDISDLKVSSHILIRRNGEIIQFVNFNSRAWHAGKSCFLGKENCNYSIGIELGGVMTPQILRTFNTMFYYHY